MGDASLAGLVRSKKSGLPTLVKVPKIHHDKPRTLPTTIQTNMRKRLVLLVVWMAKRKRRRSNHYSSTILPFFHVCPTILPSSQVCAKRLGACTFSLSFRCRPRIFALVILQQASPALSPSEAVANTIRVAVSASLLSAPPVFLIVLRSQCCCRRWRI